MAFDTVVDREQLNGAMKASADAIREKAGGDDLIEWHAERGFSDAIKSINTEQPCGNIRSYDITLPKFSNFHTLVELDEDVLAHINDPGLVVTLVNLTGYEYVNYSGAIAVVCNTVIGEISGYPVYGLANRQSSEASASAQHIFYPANNTTASWNLGGCAVFYINGNNYEMAPGDGFWRAGDYRLTFVW